MHAGAGAGAIGTRHGTLAGEKKSLGGDGRCRDGRRGGDADGCRHDTTPSPSSSPDLVFHAGQQ